VQIYDLASRSGNTNNGAGKHCLQWAICVKVFLCAKQLVNLAVEHVLPKNINRLYAVDIRCLALSYWMRRGVSSFVH